MGSADTFRFVVPLDGAPHRMAPADTVLCMGSCFAEAIGNRLRDHCFDVDINPFGAVYNPITAARSLHRLLSGRRYRSADMFEHDGLWRSFDHHTSFAAPSAARCVRGINARLTDAHRRMERLDILMLTFGTAHVWQLHGGNRIVANCHRLPQDRFTRRLLSIDEIAERWSELLGTLFAALPSLRVFLTVSPVRYLRDGAHANNVSKGHLMAAVYRLEQAFDRVHYFPAYEIVMDELRDYRFFARDRAHVTEETQEYVWERFVDACLEERARAFVERFAGIRSSMQHRPGRAGRDAVAVFARRRLQAVRQLQREFPELSLRRAEEHFEGFLR